TASPPAASASLGTIRRALRLPLRELARLAGGVALREHRGLGVVVTQALDLRLEDPHRPPEGPRGIGELLRPEQEHEHREDENQFPPAGNVHGKSFVVGSPRVYARRL